MKTTACTKVRVRQIPTSLFSVPLEILVPGPTMIERGPCGAPLLSKAERKAATCTRCTKGAPAAAL